MFGTRIPKCISLATIALPVLLMFPDTAQLFEPGNSSPCYLFSPSVGTSEVIRAACEEEAEGHARVGITPEDN